MSRQNWTYIAYALTAVTVLVFLLTMVMLSRVKVAIACIKVSLAYLTDTRRTQPVGQDVAAFFAAGNHCSLLYAFCAEEGCCHTRFLQLFVPLPVLFCTYLQVASQAVSTMPSIMLFPLLPFILEVGLIIYWVAVTAVLYSAGTPTDNWRPASQDLQPLSLKELMLTNSSTPAPPATTKPDTTNMTRTVRGKKCSLISSCHQLAV
jgi:hypothetical protein